MSARHYVCDKCGKKSGLSGDGLAGNAHVLPLNDGGTRCGGTWRLDYEAIGRDVIERESRFYDDIPERRP